MHAWKQYTHCFFLHLTLSSTQQVVLHLSRKPWPLCDSDTTRKTLLFAVICAILTTDTLLLSHIYSKLWCLTVLDMACGATAWWKYLPPSLELTWDYLICLGPSKPAILRCSRRSMPKLSVWPWKNTGMCGCTLLTCLKSSAIKLESEGD